MFLSLILLASMLVGCSERHGPEAHDLAGKWTDPVGNTLEFLTSNLFTYHRKLRDGEMTQEPVTISGEYKIVDNTHLRLDIFGRQPAIVPYSLTGDTLTLPLPPEGSARPFARSPH